MVKDVNVIYRIHETILILLSLSLSLCEMIAKLERTQSTPFQNKNNNNIREQQNESTTMKPPPHLFTLNIAIEVRILMKHTTRLFCQSTELPLGIWNIYLKLHSL